jgi:chemotaxis protein MotC
LSAVDIDRLPSSAKGQFALVKAMATPSTKTNEAIGHLGQARRFAPGTLTEEAALRRLIRIAAENAHKAEGVDVFFNHANAYFRHYSSSVYATDFLRNYGFGLVQTPEDAGDRALAHVKSVYTGLDKKQQVFLIAIIARNAVVLGRLDLGRWASDWLLDNVGPSDKLHARIELYQIATSILDAESYADSAERLGKLPVKFLGKSDMSLYLALTQLSSRIGSEIIDVEKLKEITRVRTQSFPGDEPELPFDVDEEMKLAKTNPVLVRTEELFEKADRLLER